MKKRVAITLHGIRTSGKWQKDLAPILAEHDIVPYPLDFGYFNAAQLLLNHCREEKLKWFHKEYDRVRKETSIDRPSIIAHSFGSYLVCQLLHKYPEFVCFDKVILAGSIAPANFDWAAIIKQGQVIQVRNEVATLDRWPILAKKFVRDAGDSGTKGFDGFPQGGQMCQYSHAIGHSGTHFESMYDHWAKFITCPQYLPVEDCKLIYQLLEFAAGRTADILGIPQALVRANILLPRHNRILKISEGAHYNMTYPPEKDINIPFGKGLSGIAFTERKHVGFVQTNHSWGLYALPFEELQKVDPRLEWVLSFPLADPDNGRVFGVMSVDGLTPSTINMNASDPITQVVIAELINDHVPGMVKKISMLETGGI